jgi:hypothetical protein
MAYAWIGERMAEEHRRDLAVTRLKHRRVQSRDDRMVASALPVGLPDSHLRLQLQAASQLEVYGLQSAGHRHFTHHVGTLLIRAGTRLGGASIRTS